MNGMGGMRMRNKRAGYSKGYSSGYSSWVPTWDAATRGGTDEGYYWKWCDSCGKRTEWDADACLGPVCSATWGLK